MIRHQAEAIQAIFSQLAAALHAVTNQSSKFSFMKRRAPIGTYCDVDIGITIVFATIPSHRPSTPEGSQV